MNKINWSRIGVYLSLAVAFCIGGLQVLGTQVPDSNAIIVLLTAIAGILHGPAVTASVNVAFAKAAARAGQCPTTEGCCTK